jgi:predicted O-methyltransferase YrrM
MLNQVNYIVNYLLYFFTSQTKYDIHSPFVFDFIVNVLNVRKQKPYYHTIELLRSKMLKSKALIKLKPFGAKPQSADLMRPVSDVCKRTSKSAKYAELLERICHYYQPQFAIELGTSVGVSTLYQASGIANGVLYTIEGNEDSVKVAKFNAEQAQLENIQFLVGDFQSELPQLLAELPMVDYVFFDGHHALEPTLNYFEMCLKKAHNSSVFVFDDIRWSDEMKLAWEKIKNHPQVTVTIDLYSMGIVFFRKEQEKEHFILRY